MVRCLNFVNVYDRARDRCTITPTMLTCSRNGLTIAGTNLRDDAAAEPGFWNQITSSASNAWDRITGGLTPNVPQPQDTATTAPNEPSAWNQITNAAEQAWNSIASQARQYYDLSTCQTGYNECVATSNQCTAFVAQASKDAEWSVKKANGIAVVAGDVVLGSLLGFAIGHAGKKSATAMAGRRRRRR